MSATLVNTSRSHLRTLLREPDAEISPGNSLEHPTARLVSPGSSLQRPSTVHVVDIQFRPFTHWILELIETHPTLVERFLEPMVTAHWNRFLESCRDDSEEEAEEVS